MLVSQDMASAIKDAINGEDNPGNAIKNFWNAISDYISKNLEITYSWIATDPSSGTPDPVTRVIITGEKLVKNPGTTFTPSGVKTSAGDALSHMSSLMNSDLSSWVISWPEGFSIPPVKLIPGIALTPAGEGATVDSARLHLCDEIIAGITFPGKGSATPSASGAHITYVGAASLVEIK